ncbi:MAG: hypothetical protein AAFX06_01570 [Planctomycetota bacterium]
MFFRSTRLWLFTTFVLIHVLPTHAGVIIDQIGGGPNLTAIVSPTSSYQQEVTAGVTGQLVGIDLWSWGFSSTRAPIRIGINRGTGWQTDAPDVQQIVPLTVVNQRQFIDFSSTPIHFNAGDSFLITLDGISGLGAAAYGNDATPATHSFATARR